MVHDDVEKDMGSLFKDVKYYVVGNIPQSVSIIKFCNCNALENTTVLYGVHTAGLVVLGGTTVLPRHRVTILTALFSTAIPQVTRFYGCVSQFRHSLPMGMTKYPPDPLYGQLADKTTRRHSNSPKLIYRRFGTRRRRRRRSGIAGAGLSLYARLISHFNITNIVFNYI